MFYFVHILTGALIGKYLPSLWPIIILSLLSHFVLDIIPHRDALSRKDKFMKSYKVSITKSAVLFEFADIIPSIFLIAFLWLKFNSPLMLFSIFIAILPDISRIGYVLGLKNNRVFLKSLAFHSRIQTDLPWISGLLTQLVVSIILLVAIFY